MVTISLANGQTLRCSNGWQHIHHTTHSRVSRGQVQRHHFTPALVPVGHVLHVEPSQDTDCPHCSPHVHTTITGTWWGETPA
jgi:hypothetical protein